MRLGLLEEASTESDEKEYDIQRIFLAGMNEDGLECGRYYGSNLSDGRVHTFWPILFYTIKSHAIHCDNLPGSPITSDIEVDESNPLRPTVEISYSSARKAAFLDALDDWCIMNPGRFFKLSYPGHREKSSLAPQHLLQDHEILCRATYGECLRAAIANALFALDGRRPALKMLRAGPIRGKSIGQSAKWLEQTMGVHRLTKVDVPSDTETHLWLLSRREGIFVVVVEGVDSENDVLRHAITVDVRFGFVLDCVEKSLMRFDRGMFDVGIKSQ